MHRNAGRKVMLELDTHIPECFRERLTEEEFMDRLSLYVVFS
jgi:hypothetical protein